MQDGGVMRQRVVASTMALATICLTLGVARAQNADAGDAAPGRVHPSHLNGQVWLMAGEPGESNVVVQVGDDGALVVDTGTQATASKLLEAIQGLIQQHAGDQKTLSTIIDTNGRLDH